MARGNKLRRLGAVSLALVAMSCGSGPADPGPVPFAPAAPSAYTAKVKNLLTGLAPTDAELQAVTANPQALGGLIDQWMALPQFQGKMLGFFQQSFQQTQISQLEFADQLQNSVQSWNGVDKLKFLYSAENSFPLTALQIINSGSPFTSTLTTDTFMLNVPMMAALALNDLYVVDDSGKFVPGAILTRFPTFNFTRTTAVVPFTQTIDPQSPNFIVWTDPTPYTGPNMRCAMYPATIGNKTPDPGPGPGVEWGPGCSAAALAAAPPPASSPPPTMPPGAWSKSGSRWPAKRPPSPRNLPRCAIPPPPPSSCTLRGWAL